jgi:hypothetical protein
MTTQLEDEEHDNHYPRLRLMLMFKIVCVGSFVLGRPEWPGVQLLLTNCKSSVAAGKFDRMHVVKAVEVY